MIQELPAERLRRNVDPASLGISTTQDLKPLEGIIGQRRALSALRFGLGIQEIGFNIYVAGPAGIGKMTAVKSFLEAEARRKETPADWCYLYNFEDPYQPRACRLRPGEGRQLQQDMKSLIEHVKAEVPKAFESEEYAAKQEEVVKAVEKERTQILEQLAEKATKGGLAIQTTPFGVVVVPVLGGRPLTDAELRGLPEQARADLEKRRNALQDELKAALKQVRELERRAREKLNALDKQIALFIIEGLIDDLLEKYAETSQVLEYLRSVQENLLENIQALKTGTASTPASQAPAQSQPQPPDATLKRYEVNAFVDHGRLEGAPVVVELNPTYNNLFGRVEKETMMGMLYTDFTMIKPGSLHMANGGYLVLRMEDILKNYFCWDDLKRALRSREVRIEEPAERLGFLVTKTLRPQPVSLDVKVIIVGRSLLYYLLHAYDEEFPELFKVKADFDTRTDWNDGNIQDFLSFLRTLCGKENLKDLDAGAAAKLLEQAARIAEDQEKLSMHFGAVADLVREAHFWAKRDESAHISTTHVQKAIDEKIYRSNLIQERIQEMIARGTILVDTQGATSGQVNGLSVYNLGDYEFGRPSRITASAVPGREGVVDIEREVQMGGPIHTKGVLILSGYLAQHYARDKVLTLAARLVFEQSYEGVEGDSASSTELYALLSALSGLPVRQGIAVTGSVNQRGEVQAIGGVSQKIEGFYDLCRVIGLTGEQGVMIPKSNAANLMLREDVVDEVRAGRFHIWPVATIDEGIEVLTGVPAGVRGEDGKFPDGTVGSLVEKRLQEFTESVRSLGTAGDKAAKKPPAAGVRSSGTGRRAGPE